MERRRRAAEDELTRRHSELASIEAALFVARRTLRNRRRELDEKYSYLYALRRADGLVKIGYTTDVRHRVSAHAREHGKLKILAVVGGTWEEEGQIHVRLRPHRAHAHEWYHPVPEVMAVVKELLARGAA